MSKTILAAVFTLGASLVLNSTSAWCAGGGGGGYDGMVIVNVYEYLAAHGCPEPGFSLSNCYGSPPSYRYNREAQHYGKSKRH